MKRGMNLIALAIFSILVALPACTEKPTETKQAKSEPQYKPEFSARWG